MTRETKIGLLVGLAFIIVIGILLSDYNRNEVQNAPYTLVADNLRSSTATPHNGSTQNEVVAPPVPPIPSHTVPTPQELHETSIHISPGPGAPISHVEGNEHSPVDPAPSGVVEGNNNVPPPLEAHDPPVAADPRLRIPDTTLVNGNPPVAPRPPAPAPAPGNTVNGARQYVAIEGDTVSKLAGRFLGKNTLANREAILAINPTLKANPNNVIVGRTYMIPNAKPATAVAANTPASAAPSHPAAPAPVTAAPPAPGHVAAATPTNDGPHYFYTVKENDNLWKIASEQLGDGTAVEAIKELNKELLKGHDSIRPNMRLRLPAKPVASVN